MWGGGEVGGGGGDGLGGGGRSCGGGEGGEGGGTGGEGGGSAGCSRDIVGDVGGGGLTSAVSVHFQMR